VTWGQRPGISRSVLAQRLRHLEREGVVDRQVADDGPPSLVRALPRWFRLRP